MLFENVVLPLVSADLTRILYVVFALNPAMLTLCEVTLFVSSVVLAPYVVVLPYATCESEASSVVHVMLRESVLIFVPVTELITGAVVSTTTAGTTEIGVLLVEVVVTELDTAG